MFDPDTSKLISQAPSLDGLDLAKLPAQLTKAYTSIVTARMRMREIKQDGDLPVDIQNIAKEMRRIAFTNEAFVSVLPEREDRASAAFVAGAAHHVSLMIERMRPVGKSETRLTLSAVAPEVSATLLFMIAEATADAAEMAKQIAAPDGNTVESHLLRAIVDLSKGQLDDILTRELPANDAFELSGLGDQAVAALHLLMLQGMRQLASELIGTADSGNQSASSIFKRVKNLCVEEIEIEGHSYPVFSAFPGPHHLASLLISVADNMTPTAVINIDPPGNLDRARWAAVLRMIAKRRPYLWRNHRSAIESGYLNSGISAVVSFPTGAGKSTLSELKIAASMLSGKKVVFLVPTLALVEQTASALRKTFPDASIDQEQGNASVLDDLISQLPSVFVMTPERCLALLGYEPDAFSDVGLLVFDECHLMHAATTDKSRRAIDAMLCVLNFATIAPAADLLLLSAMMKNTKEIAEWVSEMTTRTCLALDLTWKPTRQVRGCVVYDADRIDAINSNLKLARANQTRKSKVARMLTARPVSLFSLQQTWISRAKVDYTLQALLDKELLLKLGTANRRWYLTPNGVQVASELAIAAASKNLKTLVFIQTIRHTNSAVKHINAQATVVEISLTSKENELLDEAIQELGGASYSYLSKDDSGIVRLACVCHHGLLLPSERRLHESLFKREDGVKIMVATSTLAQGMNLPSEVVIIGGDDRFDPGVAKRQPLEAHELLNAAGRAGRAGESSYGVVLVVPSKVIDFRYDTGHIAKHWRNLQAVFAQSDQCVSIDDPLTALLDQLQLSAESQSPLLEYLLRRLPLVSDEVNEDASQALIRKSFAAFRKRTANDNAWIEARLEAVRAARKVVRRWPTWVDQLACVTGVSAEVISELGDACIDLPISNMASVEECREWMLGWLNKFPHFVPQLIRPTTLSELVKGHAALTDAERGRYFLEFAANPLQLWMAGATLVEIERGFGTSSPKLGTCDAARKFVLKIIPELAFVFGLPLQVVTALKKGTDGEQGLPGLGISTLSSCVRLGFDVAEKLAFRQIIGRHQSRVLVHKMYATENVEPATKVEDFKMAMMRVSNSILAGF